MSDARTGQQRPSAQRQAPPQQQRQPGSALAVLRQHQVERTDNFAQQLDAYTPQLLQVLPPSVPVDRFKRVLITAVASNPDLLYCDRRSLFMAAAKCAADGLLPDGRQAVLLPFNTEVKLRDPNTGLDRRVRMDLVQYIPMVIGIRERMRRTGEVLAAVAEPVYRNDTFRYRLGDEPFIEHEPPALGDERGEVIGAYAIIKLKNGEVIRDVMNKRDIEAARAKSKQKDGMLWSQFYGEAARKTVLKRASKQAPQTADEREALERIFERDEEEPAMPEIDAASLPAREPEPVRQVEHRPEPPVEEVDTRPEFAVVDLDGVETILRNADHVVEVMTALLGDAAKRGLARLAGAWESNQETVAQLGREGWGEQAVSLAREYERLHAALMAPRNASRAEVGGSDPSRGERIGNTGQAVDTELEKRSGGTAEAVQQRSSGPADGTSNTEMAHRAPAPADAAPSEEGSLLGSELGSKHIPPVMKAGREDWRTWTVAMFIPKLRQERTTNELARRLGDNEECLNRARAVLSPVDKRDLEDAIAHQWAEVDRLEKAAAATATTGAEG